MLEDDAVSLIKRLIEATQEDEAISSDANINTSSIRCILDEMKGFLARRSTSTDCECGNGSIREAACQFHSSEAAPHGSEEYSEPERMLRLVLEGTDKDAGEIDLSAPAFAIGDAGCMALCNALEAPTSPALSFSICVLDLEANGLSEVGGSALAAALQGGAAPSLTSLNVGCNSIGGHGASKLASALRNGCCPLLQSLDLHGNTIGDDGCVALGQALATGALSKLEDLDLSANRIEDRGCKALAPLFGSVPCCPLLTHLNLRENGIESVDTLFLGATLDSGTTTLPELTLLDLSWNSICNFEHFAKALDCTLCPALSELDLKGNSLSDSGCERLCAKLKASGATPLLILQGDGEGGGEDDTIPVQEGSGHGGVGSEGRLRRYLRLLADGDATNSQVCRLPLWESTNTSDVSAVSEKDESQAEFENADQVCGSTDVPLSYKLLRRDGFVVQPPLACSENMARLAAVMERLESDGWPPVFCFMSDSVWDFVAEQVWPAVRTVLGVDCVLDSGSAFAWSLKATGKSTFPRDGEFRSWQNAVSSINPTVPKEKEDEGHRGFGSSFGLPHRDYSAVDSLYHDPDEEGEEGKVGPKAATDHPAILNVWIPLNDATLDNGCMYVVPREFDTDFARTDGHHAHMNPATEVQRGLSSKIHFPLHGVRALPAPAGSMIAWYGNTIHWGSTCSRFAKAPRKSIALTFRRADIKVGAGVHELDEASRIHRPSPPITRSQARDMSPAFRLALISRSLLLYNQWHALADDAVPPLIYETTAIPEERTTEA